MIQSLLQAEHLSFQYPTGKQALQDVTFQVHTGERIAVLGSNGAGKSTLFQLLIGLLKPQEGSLFLQGKPIQHRSADLLELRKNICMVFQEPDNQIIAPTVWKEVSFGPLNLKLDKPEAEARTRQSIDSMHLQTFINEAPHYLSGGEKKRVTIADALAMRPKVVLFDEPTAGLDCTNAQAFETILQDLSNDGLALLISTHDMDFALRWADRILVFAHGQLLQDASPLAVFSNKELLEKAGLQMPLLIQITKALQAHGILAENPPPKSMAELEYLLAER